MTKSFEILHPPSTAPTIIQIVAEQNTRLRRQYRTNQRTGSRDGREMMAESDPTRSGNIIASVRESEGGSRMRIIQFENFDRDKCRIEAVAERPYTHNAATMNHSTFGASPRAKAMVARPWSRRAPRRRSKSRVRSILTIRAFSGSAARESSGCGIGDRSQIRLAKRPKNLAMNQVNRKSSNPQCAPVRANQAASTRRIPAHESLDFRINYRRDEFSRISDHRGM